MKKKLAFIFLITVLIAACGSRTSPNGNAAAQVGPQATSDGPTLVADKPNDNSATPKKKKRPIKKIIQPPAQLPVVETPVANPQPVVATPPTPAPVMAAPKATEPTVVAMGSTGKKASDFMDQGYNSAILNARFCSNTGQFPDGSHCYLVYSDGRTEWASANNRPAAEAFIAQLSQEQEAEQKAKKEKKAAKKRKE